MQSIGQTNRNVAMQNAVYWPAAGLGWVWEVDMQALEGEHKVPQLIHPGLQEPINWAKYTLQGLQIHFNI